jgi:hypothetical protein
MRGRHWSLACCDCLVGVELGRLVEIDDDGLPVGPHFQGFRDVDDNVRVEGIALRRLVELFLIQHLGHDVGIVDSDAVVDALGPYEMGAEPFSWIGRPGELTGIYNAERSRAATTKLVRLIESRSMSSDS